MKSQAQSLRFLTGWTAFPQVTGASTSPAESDTRTTTTTAHLYGLTHHGSAGHAQLPIHIIDSITAATAAS